MNQYLQPYDVVMLVVLIGAAVYGAWKGFAWQIASLASIVVSAGVAVHGSAAVASYFKVSEHEQWNRFLAMFVLYSATAGMIWLAFRFVSGFINRLQLKEFDRQLGITIGLLKGALYCIVITFFAVTLSEPIRQQVLRAKSGDLIARTIRNANPILPDDVRQWLGKYIDELDAKLHAPPQEAAPSQSATATAADYLLQKSQETDAAKGAGNAVPKKWLDRLRASTTDATTQEPAPISNPPTNLPADE